MRTSEWPQLALGGSPCGAQQGALGDFEQGCVQDAHRALIWSLSVPRIEFVCAQGVGVKVWCAISDRRSSRTLRLLVRRQAGGRTGSGGAHRVGGCARRVPPRSPKDTEGRRAHRRFRRSRFRLWQIAEKVQESNQEPVHGVLRCARSGPCAHPTTPCDHLLVCAPRVAGCGGDRTPDFDPVPFTHGNPVCETLPWSARYCSRWHAVPAAKH